MFYSPLEQFYAISLGTFTFFGLDISFTNMMLPFVFSVILVSLLIFFKMPTMTLLPLNWSALLEELYGFILNMVLDYLGREGVYYFPFIFTVFFMVLTGNLMALIPYGISSTSLIAATLWLSLTIGVGVFLLTLSLQGLNFIYIFLPPSPLWLLPLLFIIEVFSYVLRSFSLAIRLSANILAGHILVYIVTNFFLKVGSVKIWASAIVGLFIIAVLCLELGIAFLQSYVFTILLCIYFSDAIKGAQH